MENFEFDNIMVLDDGSEYEFLDQIEYEGEEYIILTPDVGAEEIGEVVIFLIQPADDDSEEESFAAVESEETLQAVFELFKAKFND